MNNIIHLNKFLPKQFQILKIFFKIDQTNQSYFQTNIYPYKIIPNIQEHIKD